MKRTRSKSKIGQPRVILVIGKRWFDKVNGNTYCTAQVWFDGDLVHKVPFEYGYGNFYIQAAADQLDKSKKLKLKRYDHGGHESLWQYCERKGIKLVDQVFDVNRKRDL